MQKIVPDVIHPEHCFKERKREGKALERGKERAWEEMGRGGEIGRRR